MVCKLFAAFACMAASGADDISRIVEQAIYGRPWRISGVETNVPGEHMKLDTQLEKSGPWWARETRLTATVEYAPVGVLEAVDVYVAFDRNGDGRIAKSEWVLAGHAAAHEKDGRSLAIVRDVLLARDRVRERIVQHYRGKPDFYDEWFEDDLPVEDP